MPATGVPATPLKLSSHYFVFVNRRKTQMKMLYFTATGYCLWAKRLEQGQFRVPLSTSALAGENALLREQLGAQAETIRQLTEVLGQVTEVLGQAQHEVVSARFFEFLALSDEVKGCGRLLKAGHWSPLCQSNREILRQSSLISVSPVRLLVHR